MSDVNTVVLGGRVTRDPLVKTTPSGVHVCDVGVASNRYSKDGRKFTTFTRVTLWNKQAEWAGENLGTGDTVLVQGCLVDDNYEQDGKQTSGRLKIEHARVQLIRKKAVDKNPEEPSVEAPEVPEV